MKYILHLQDQKRVFHCKGLPKRSKNQFVSRGPLRSSEAEVVL